MIVEINYRKLKPVTLFHIGSTLMEIGWSADAKKYLTKSEFD